MADTADLGNGGYGDFSQEVMNSSLKSLFHGDSEDRIWAARAVRRFGSSSENARAYLGQRGAIPPLISMLASSDLHAQEAALQALGAISLNLESNKQGIVKEGAISHLTKLLESDNIYMRESAATVVHSLSSAKFNKEIMGESGLIPLLVGLLTTGTVQAQVDAVMSLGNLSSNIKNLFCMREAGAIAPLLSLLKQWKKSSMGCERIAFMLKNLCQFEDSTEQIYREDGIFYLVEVMEEGTDLGKEYSVEALLAMCQKSNMYKQAVMKEGAFPGLLQLTVEGNMQARNKAMSLLQLLRNPVPRRVRSSSEDLERVVDDIATQIDYRHGGTVDVRGVLHEIIKNINPMSNRSTSSIIP